MSLMVVKETHCSCGYEFADGMQFCPYCGIEREVKKKDSEDDFYLKYTKELLEDRGYILNSSNEEETEFIYQKENVQVTVSKLE